MKSNKDKKNLVFGSLLPKHMIYSIFLKIIKKMVNKGSKGCQGEISFRHRYRLEEEWRGRQENQRVINGSKRKILD